MCLAIPAQVKELDEKLMMGTVDIMGVTRRFDRYSRMRLIVAHRLRMHRCRARKFPVRFQAALRDSARRTSP